MLKEKITLLINAFSGEVIIWHLIYVYIMWNLKYDHLKELMSFMGFIYTSYIIQNIIIVILIPPDERLTRTFLKDRKRAEWFCCHWDTRACVYICNWGTCWHINTHTLCPWSSGRALFIGASLGRFAECSGCLLVFWFWRLVVKIADILQALG